MCVGNFYDASNPEVFESVLDLVLEQALHNTTVQVDFLDNKESQQLLTFHYHLQI